MIVLFEYRNIRISGTGWTLDDAINNVNDAELREKLDDAGLKEITIDEFYQNAEVYGGLRI